jgi:predicted HNH restriction endonuclease
LLARYSTQHARALHRPGTRVLNSRTYERNPLVIAIARVRAAHRCEVPGCTHPTFQTVDGVAYTEVHHIEPLADGGEDTIENVACICPTHHREVHLGVRAVDLHAQLRAVRALPAN